MCLIWVYASSPYMSLSLSFRSLLSFIIAIHLLFFVEDRLKEIQKSRNPLYNNTQNDHQHPAGGEGDHDVMLQLRNAAGLRKPMLLYNCISCDRPVDISLRGVMGSIPQNFPAKKSMGPYTSYDLDNVSCDKSFFFFSFW